jgi:hypothetical protein
MTTSSRALWARPRTEGPYPLRRGAWYRVTTFAKTAAVLDVNRVSVIVPRSAVELVGTLPRRWTVVPRPAKVTGPAENWGDRYAVCPRCRTRAPLAGVPPTMRCARCNGLFPVAWDEQYLDRP